MDESRIDTAPVGPSPEMLQCIRVVVEEVLDRRGGAVMARTPRGTPWSEEHPTAET